MIVAWERKDLEALEGPLALSVGVFDGVHRGHHAVFAALRHEAGQRTTLVVTLDPHPLEVLKPERAPALLTTPSERIALVGEKTAAPDALWIHPFDREIAALSPAGFLTRLVPARCRLEILTVGYDFRMGRDRAGGFQELATQGHRDGFRVIQVAPSQDSGAPVSSSRIRELVAAGRARDAAELLGHPYRIDGTVVPGRGIGRTLDFPTANVDVGDDRKLLPGFGVYAVRVRILDGEASEVLPGVMNRGVRPTFGVSEPALEVHLPGFSGDLVGRRLAVELIERIREEQAFPGPEELAAAISADVEEARKILQEGK